MTDGTDRNGSPHPDPAAGSGGYGYPGAPAPGGYGYPQAGQPNPYQQPADAQPQPQAWAAGLPTENSGFDRTAPQPDWQQAQFPPPVSDQPDWQALADENESRRGRRKTVLIAGVGVLVLALAAGGGWFALRGTGDGDDGKPAAAASGSPDPSAPASGGAKPPANDSPTVEGESNLLRDRNGRLHVALGPDAQVAKLENRSEVRFKGSANSYAQGAEPAVETSESFTVSARVFGTSERGSRVAVSQGDGISYAYELGFEESGGKKSWVFRVQTGDKGAASTAVQVLGDASGGTKKWTLLTGTYDVQKKQIALYVDDKPAGTAEVPAIWSGPGPVQLGRARHHGIWSGSFIGSMDHVRVWKNAALTAEQVAALKNNKLDKKIKPAHSWLIG
ncbi:LamG-like jellyroll fold domain-containing protein [Streptomyces sp. NPDC089799]|uniref:LamG-like jellyroll fold domain-containing protein n=1 Tax=Streptomyces sp. NPDC089799 TaxID=3155066 RepID=UPI00341568EF